MSEHLAGSDEIILKRALELAGDTKFIAVEEGARHRTANVFRENFGPQHAVIVADENTYAAAGKDVEASFARDGQPQPKRFIFGSHIYADDDCVQELTEVLRALGGIPVAVGSGTVNDPDQGGIASQRPAIHGGGHRGLNGWLLRLRSIDYKGRFKGHGGVPRTQGCAG